MEAPFFPNVASASLQLESGLRAIAAALPEQTRCDLYALMSQAHAAFVPTAFVLTEARTLVRQGGAEIAFPRPMPLVKLAHVLCGYRQWLERKYALPGFVTVEPGDIVVDCGAYVGGFSLSAAAVGAHVHVFEPAPANFACAAENLARFANVTLNAAGLYARTQRMPLNLSASSVEHSLLSPDDGAAIAHLDIAVFSLADYCRDRGVSQLDFLKLEAEGVEPEIVDGLGDIRPRKLAIDVSPEREGQSPAAYFEAALPKLGFKLRQRGHVMFARLE